MTCRELQDRLLLSDDPATEARGADAAEHVATCPQCAALLAKLTRLENAVRAMTVPQEASASAKAAFLQRLQTSLTGASRNRTLTHPSWWQRRTTWSRLAAAASVLIVVGLGIWIIAGNVQRADASDEIVDQLVEWNVTLAEAVSDAERSQIFSRKSEELRRQVESKPLSPEERELARRLFENGRAMATQPADAIDDADRLNDIADILLRRIQVATDRGNMKAVRAYSRNYALLRAIAGGDELEELADAPVDVPPHRLERLTRAIGRNRLMQQRLQALLERYPAATKQEILNALKLPQRPKNPRFRQQQQQWQLKRDGQPATRPTTTTKTRPIRPDLTVEERMRRQRQRELEQLRQQRAEQGRSDPAE